MKFLNLPQGRGGALPVGGFCLRRSAIKLGCNRGCNAEITLSVVLCTKSIPAGSALHVQLMLATFGLACSPGSYQQHCGLAAGSCPSAHNEKTASASVYAGDSFLTIAAVCASTLWTKVQLILESLSGPQSGRPNLLGTDTDATQPLCLSMEDNISSPHTGNLAGCCVPPLKLSSWQLGEVASASRQIQG